MPTRKTGRGELGLNFVISVTERLFADDAATGKVIGVCPDHIGLRQAIDAEAIAYNHIGGGIIAL